MSHPRLGPHQLRNYCFALLFAVTLALCLPLRTLALATHAMLAHATPAFHVSAGFNTRFRDGNWIPIQIALSNDGADFTGTVSVNVPAAYAGSAASPTATMYQTAITLANGAQKQVTIYAPFSFGSSGSVQNISVDLLDTNKHVVSTQVTSLRTLAANDIFVGILSDQSSGFGPLNAVTLPNQADSIVTEQLNANTMPSSATVLKNFNVIILDNFTTSTLSHEQLDALQSWVRQGGALIVVGGPEWRRTLGPFPTELLPVTISGTGTLPAGTHLLPIGGPLKSGSQSSSDTVQTGATTSMAMAKKGSSVILSAKNVPLLVQASQEQGLVCYLAFDPTLEPVVSWSGATTLWEGLLLRVLGDQLLLDPNSTNVSSTTMLVDNSGDITNLLQTLLPNTFPSIWLLIVLLLGYILVLGPVRLLIVRRLKNRDWSWRIVLGSVVVFSLLTYGIAVQEKGTSIVSDSISLVQLERPSTSSTVAHVTTYVGVFVPNQGDFQVHIPDISLVQPVMQSQYGGPSSSTQPTTISTVHNGTDVNLRGVDIWTLRALISEHDRQVQGRIVSHLTVQNGILQGTVTNMLSYPLNDVYILTYNSFLAIDHLDPAQTKQVNLPLNTADSSQSMPLAAQIAHSKNLPYESYYGGSQLHSEQQRHIAVLSTLSGEASSCPNSPCYLAKTASYNGGPSYVVNGSYPTFMPDPLLLPGAPVTLIGWANQLLDRSGSVSVNGTTPPGAQETLIQAPLDIDFAAADALPSSFTTGQIVNVQGQGDSVQVRAPNIYSITTGSVSFEFIVPDAAKVHATSLTIFEPKNITQTTGSIVKQIQGTISTVNQAHAYLYNWRMSSWDAVAMNQYTITVPDARPYVSPGGRVLVQFANQNTALGTVLLGRPSLAWRATA
jgi:uncharacterized membrane protein YhaH (DUF805 family)